MSTTTSMKDWLNTLPNTVNPLSGNILAYDWNGNPSKTAVTNLLYLDLDSKETAQAVLTIQEFATKYLNPNPVGTCLTMNRNSGNAEWRVKVDDNLTFSVREYLIRIVKKSNTLTVPWGYITIVLTPSYRDKKNVYIISLSTNATGTIDCVWWGFEPTLTGGG